MTLPNELATDVLIIEDDPGDALLAEEYLSKEDEDFVVRWRPTLAEGLGAINDHTKCILLDLGLPDARGTEAVVEIARAAPSIPVVVLTGFGDRDAGLKAVAAGAQDYLVKDEVTPATLSRSIRYAIARAGNEERDLALLEAALRAEENRRLAVGLRPKLLVQAEDLVSASVYRPASRDGWLGGDFLDAVELPDGRVRLVLGDVSGHGPEEAALGVTLRVGWRGLVLADLDPDETLADLELLLAAERSDPHTFATVCDVTIDPDRSHARVCRAGHPAPLLINDGTVAEFPVPPQRPLGVPGPPPHNCAVRLPRSAWTMLLFTDGVFEGRVGDGSRLGLSRFAEWVGERGLGPAPTESDLVALVERSETANGGPLSDDVALLACGWSP